MNRSLFVAGVGSAAAALALGLSGVASAEPEDPAPVVDGTAAEAPSAADEVAALQAQGKSVQVIGNDNGVLQTCDVVNTTEGGEANTVMVEVDCGLNYP